MQHKSRIRLGKHDVLVEPDLPSIRWRIVDHWRDVYVLEQLDRPWRRRFVYADELCDASRFERAGLAAVGDGREAVAPSREG